MLPYDDVLNHGFVGLLQTCGRKNLYIYVWVL
uniref:Uncharacterized protein n=1 Tax=Vitis vinifera TaxID=29760 RepID=F6HQU1_VITVI